MLIKFTFFVALPSSFTYIGCHIDDGSRDLPDRIFSHSHMTHELCATHCSGYQYMALQVRSQCYSSSSFAKLNVVERRRIILLINLQAASYCFCGNSYGGLGEDANACNMDCTGDNTQTCGAGWRNSIYQLQAGKLKSLICNTFLYT